MAKISSTHPLYVMMAELVNQEVSRHISPRTNAESQTYLIDLLLDFIRTDRLYTLKTPDGKPITSVIEMIAEGDVRLHADSFDREREVHKYIGDFILFWSGIYPDHLTQIKLKSPADLKCDYTQQGRESYHLVSTFNHPPYNQMAPVFSDLSEGFEDFAFVLRQVSQKSGLYAA